MALGKAVMLRGAAFTTKQVAASASCLVSSFNYMARSIVNNENCSWSQQFWYSTCLQEQQQKSIRSFLDCSTVMPAEARDMLGPGAWWHSSDSIAKPQQSAGSCLSWHSKVPKPSGRLMTSVYPPLAPQSQAGGAMHVSYTRALWSCSQHQQQSCQSKQQCS